MDNYNYINLMCYLAVRVGFPGEFSVLLPTNVTSTYGNHRYYHYSGCC